MSTKQLYLSVITREDDDTKPIVDNLYTLSEDECEQYPKSEQNIKHWLQTDIETFAMLEDAYQAFLTAVSNVENMLKSNNPVPSVREELININSKFLSLLSIAKLYLDHTASKIGSKHAEALKLHKDATSQEFDDNFAYRFYYQLRNYAQHRGLPLTGLNATGSINLDTKEADYTFELFFIKSELIEYKKIWSRLVYPDLVAAAERIEALPLTKEFMACMRRIRTASVKAFTDIIEADIEAVREIAAKGEGREPLYMVDLQNAKKQGQTLVSDVHFREVPTNLVAFADSIKAD